MQKVVLRNGLRVLYQHKPGNAVVVEVLVNVGSNQEKPNERGISHFIEHLVFEGTKKRPTNQLITNEIEKIGGEFNAYTTGDRTCYYVKVLPRHFATAVKILADILQNPLFAQKFLEKEKNIVLKEIDMLYDEPRMYQWLVLQENLFEKHPCRFPTYGDQKIIRQLTRKQVLQYVQRYYHPNNMVVSVVGEVPGWKRKVGHAFSRASAAIPGSKAVVEPPSRQPKTIRRKSTTANSYLVMGFKTVPLSHRDAPTLEVINGILGRGQSGRMFSEIRTKRGLAYDVGTQNISELSYGYFAVYATIDRKNLATVRKVMARELSRLGRCTARDVREGKEYVEGSYYLELEDVQKMADQLLLWEQVRDARLMDEFIAKVRKVSVQDVRRVAGMYFKNPTVVVLEGK